jgi:hypothetical protein
VNSWYSIPFGSLVSGNFSLPRKLSPLIKLKEPGVPETQREFKARLVAQDKLTFYSSCVSISLRSDWIELRFSWSFLTRVISLAIAFNTLRLHSSGVAYR